MDFLVVGKYTHLVFRALAVFILGPVLAYKAQQYRDPWLAVLALGVFVIDSYTLIKNLLLVAVKK